MLTGEGVVTAVHFGELNARGQRSEVDRFEDLLVELLGALGIKGQPQQDEGVGKALDSDADRPVAHVGVARRVDRVVVDVDDLV